MGKEGILIKDPDSVKDNIKWKEIKSILRRLPLDQCSFERNSTTGELGWRAPQGYAFEIGGEFIIFSRGPLYPRPQPSRNLFTKIHKERYEICLRETKRNKRRAFDLLMERVENFKGEYLIPEDFVGKWLIIHPNIDGSRTYLDSPKVPITFDSVGLYVSEDVQVGFTQDDYVEAFDMKSQETGKVTRYAFRPTGVIEWRQQYAAAELGRCGIAYVNEREQEQHLEVVHIDVTGLFIPEYSGIVDPPEPRNPNDLNDIEF